MTERQTTIDEFKTKIDRKEIEQYYEDNKTEILRIFKESFDTPVEDEYVEENYYSDLFEIAKKWMMEEEENASKNTTK